MNIKLDYIKRKSGVVAACVLGMLLSMLVSCANMGGGPQGGPKDMTPPKYVKSIPNRSQTKVRPERVEILFDEYVEIKDGMNVVVTPPFAVQPEVKAIGKKVIVEFADTLKSNTTYVIDFSNSIVDYREGNPLRNYYFEFSTGEEIDSFTIAGNIVDAQTLVPMQGILVGAYENWIDTTFKTVVLEHLAKTDANGRFLLRGLKETPYRIVALEDGNSNFMYDSPGEVYGLLDTVVTSRKIMEERCDTTYKQVNRDSLLGLHNIDTTVDTLIIDTIRCSIQPKYLPDSIEFVVSQKFVPVQEYVKGERKNEHYFTLYFNNTEPRLPTLRLTNDTANTSWYVLEPSVTTDTLNYYLTDSVMVKSDSLEFEMTYDLYVDSLKDYVAQKDTVFLFYKRPKKQKKDKEADKLKMELGGSVEIDAMPIIKFDRPVAAFDTSMIYVYAKEDTTKRHLPFTLEGKAGMKEYEIKGEWENGKQYMVHADSGTIHNIYGLPNDSLELRFKLKTVEDYSTLKLILENKPSGTLYLELFSNNKTVYREKVGEQNTLNVKNLKPATYAVSLWQDANDNGKWDAGDFEEKRQPEEVWFFHKALQMSPGWDYEETWNIGDRPKHKQRPSSTYPPKKKKK